MLKKKVMPHYKYIIFNIKGKLVAVGDSEGVVTVIELCDSLNVQ